MELVPKNCAKHPHCPHGPCLMFERYSSAGLKSGRRFYACSACRNRSVCSFFHWVDDKFSMSKKEHWDRIIEESKPRFTHEECMKRLKEFKKLTLEERRYCKTCSLLILPDEVEHNDHHAILYGITSDLLLTPSSFFEIKSDKRAEAQYFFAEQTTQFLTKLMKKLGFTKLVLIGTPKIHEHLIQRKPPDEKMSSILLDIDYRYMQFYDSDHFFYYNMLNNHFFNGAADRKTFKSYLKQESGDKVAILVDPPFGAMVDALSYTLRKISKWWREVNSKTESEFVPILWFFPYFMEPKILSKMPQLSMMDYKVNYSNHVKFSGKRGFKGSPVRIFSNIYPASFWLPQKEGYRFCEMCDRYVSAENIHCPKCNLCTTKHGKTYKHCDICQKCVKTTFLHCEKHGRCCLGERNKLLECCASDTATGGNHRICRNCLGVGHNKRDCPEKKRRNNSNSVKRKRNKH